MDKEIITIQYTKSEYHTNGMIGAWGDWELTEHGKAQAFSIGEFLASEIDYQNYVMYVSDLKRAYQTAEQINSSLHIRLIVTDIIREVNAGDGNGKAASWYNSNKKPRAEKYDPDYKPFENAESDRDLWNRLYPFYKEICSNDNDKIIIISHGTTISFLQSMLIGNNFELLSRCRFNGCSGSISKFKILSGGKTIVNYINHRLEN